MFGSLGNLGTLLKQARQIEGRLAGVGDELRSQKATGTAGGGLVELEVNGLEEVLRCKIDPSLIAQGDRELLEDLGLRGGQSGDRQGQATACRCDEESGRGLQRARAR